MKNERVFSPATLARLLDMANYLVRNGQPSIGARIAAEACAGSTATLTQLRQDLRTLVFTEEPLLRRDGGALDLLQALETPDRVSFKVNMSALTYELFNERKRQWMTMTNSFSSYLVDCLTVAIGELHNLFTNVYGYADEFLLFGADVDVSDEFDVVGDRCAQVVFYLDKTIAQIGLPKGSFRVQSVSDIVQECSADMNHILVVTINSSTFEQDQSAALLCKASDFMHRASRIGVTSAVKQIANGVRA